jgi:predicted  nucleic acid-binding Zn-ribbon protein
LEQTIVAELQVLTARESAARKRAEDARRAAKAEEQRRQTELDREYRHEEADFTAQQKNLERRLAGARADLAKAKSSEELNRALLASYGRITASRYALAVAGVGVQKVP